MGGGSADCYLIFYWGEGINISVITCYIGERGGVKMAVLTLHNLWTGPQP